METDTILQIDDACIAFGEDILFSDFCLQLHEEEIACISGQSGRGKSSLLNAILGFIPLRTGRIIVNNILLEKATIDQVSGMDTARAITPFRMGERDGSASVRTESEPEHSLFSRQALRILFRIGTGGGIV